jgi:hypothetical protein
MPSAASTPTLLGLYINSFKRPSGAAQENNPYKWLLGTDNLGAYPSGNKLTELYNYTSQFGYNYGIFYDLDGSPFVGGSQEAFVAGTPGSGNQLLDILMPQAHAAGLTTRSAVMTIFNPFNTINTGDFNGYDGIADVVKIIAYNTYTGNAANKIFHYVSCETEFWNFHYDTTPLPNNVRIRNNGTTGEIVNDPSGSMDFTTLGLSIKDFVVVNNQWRQIVSIGTNIVLVDRDWNVPTTSAPWAASNGNGNGEGQVDYITYLHRITQCIKYIDSLSNALKVDLYIAFPKEEGGIQQLAKLYQAGVERINLTNYALNARPRWSLIDAGSYGPGGSSYKRVSDDIVSDGVLRNLGQIMSAESATLNNNKVCAGSSHTNFNFSGYFFEGRSVLPHTNGTDWRAIDGGGNINTSCSCGGCTSIGLVKPDVTYNPLSLDEIWQYTAEVPPAGAGYPAAGSSTFNEIITAGGTMGTNLDSFINFDTMIIFDQEFMRQLIITPAVALNLSTTSTNLTCNGSDDGTATVSVVSGVAPYTYLWDDAGASTTASITGLPPGTYTVEVTDAAATVETASVTITEPAVISFTATVVDADCAGLNGSITISSVFGGAPYQYSVVTTGGTKVWTGLLSYTGLPAGVYDVSVATGDPTAGCFVTVQRTILTGSSFTISEAHTNITCNGGSNGTITLTPTPAGTYTYNLYNSLPSLVQTNATGVFNNLLPAAYTASAVNSLGCTSNTLSITITQPTTISASAVSASPTCYLGVDGTVTITASGGTGSLTYTLFDTSGNTVTQGSGSFTGLAPGVYGYYVEDASGCTSNISTITVLETGRIDPVYEVTQIPQGETTGGAITLIAISGGTNPYTYLWSTGATTASITSLTPGEYIVDIEDAEGCTVRLTFNIRVECDNLTYNEYKVHIYKAQCCAGNLAKKFVRLAKQGNKKEASEIMHKLSILTMILRSIRCDDNPGNEYCFTCEDMILLIENIKNICNCDCCDEIGEETVTVTFNSDTNQLDII